MLTKYSIEDDSALRNKVTEALTVYDEYVKNSQAGEGEADKAKEDDKAEA